MGLQVTADFSPVLWDVHQKGEAMPTMHCIERPPNEPLFYVTGPQYAGTFSYADFQVEAAMWFRLFQAGEVHADQFPHIQVIPPYSAPFTVVLNFTREPKDNGAYSCYVVDPSDSSNLTKVCWINDVPIMFEVKP